MGYLGDVIRRLLDAPLFECLSKDHDDLLIELSTSSAAIITDY